MSNSHQPGSFYLGRLHVLSTGKTHTEQLSYESSNLTTHAVCVGMTGSGKTGLCVTLLEEAALNGIPAIAIDPKGDLGNLLLAFPNLQPSDFRPWIDASEATRQQMKPDEFAAKQAWQWRNGLSKWGIEPDRIRRYCDSTERIIYTPGSSAGIPITVLKSFCAPPAEFVSDTDAFNERITSATSGLLALLGIDADPVRSREHIFLAKLFEAAWRAGRDLDLNQLIEHIQRPLFDRVGAVDLESFFPASERHKLAMGLNNLLASPSFAGWLQGEPLDVQRMLYTPAGKPRLAIISIAHLDDAQRMFFVTLLLNEVLAWARAQPGTSSLRALLYMDEVFGYFPPLVNPPSKRPMLTLLKQARAYGLGCVLATQNPVDLDYKGLSNAGTWFLGRLQTERDKARVIEGLEGASAEAGASFNRQHMEATLAALGKRVFLMNNVHNDSPSVFHTRWAMSYLCGPLTRSQIKMLMDPVRGNFEPKAPATPLPSAATDNSVAAPVNQQPASSAANSRPILPAGIPEKFAAARDSLMEGERLEYRPAIVGEGKVHFVQTPNHIDTWRNVLLLKPLDGNPTDDLWDDSAALTERLAVETRPAEKATFGELPAKFAREKSYPEFRRQLADHFYRTEVLGLWRLEVLGVVSRPAETEQDFRSRVEPVIAARHADERQRIEQQFSNKLASLETRIATARTKVSTQKWQFWTRVSTVAWAAVEALMRLKGVGRSGRPRSATTAIRGAATEHEQQMSAQNNLEKLLADQQNLERERDRQLAELEARHDPSQVVLDRVEIKPRKSDVEVDSVCLVWLPWRVDEQGRAEPLFEMSEAESAAGPSSNSQISSSTTGASREPLARG